MGSVDLSAIASYLVLINLLYGGFLGAVGIRALISKVEEYGQKFYGLTFLIKGIVLILISLFLYYKLNSGLDPAYIVFAMILAPVVSSHRSLWESGKRMYRALFESRADILVQLNNKRWQELEDGKLEYTSATIHKVPKYARREKSVNASGSLE